jgi:hypothetical protein
MEEMTPAMIFGLGCLGGAIPDLLRLVKGRYDGAPKYVATYFFWIMFVILVLLGGGVAFGMGASSAKEALALGFTAPEVISRMLGAKDTDRGAMNAGFVQSVRRWWSY